MAYRSSNSDELLVIRSHIVAASGVLTLEDEIHAPTAQLFKFDKTLGISTAVVSGAGTKFDWVNGKPY